MTKTKQRKRSHFKKRSPKNLGQITKRLFPPNTYYAHTMPGLEKLAWRAVQQSLPKAKLLGFRTVGKQNGLLIFRYDGDPAPLLNLRPIEDIFLVLASLKKLPEGRVSLAALAGLMQTQVNWPQALKQHRDATGYQPKAGRQTTFRVISRILGYHPFHRKEAQARLVNVIQKANSRWVLVKDDSTLEVWLTIFDQAEVLVGLRLSDRSMRQRPYKVEDIPASLRPSVAATMVFLSNPGANDIFLDPMCGAGTILIERATWGPYAELLGGDIRSEAIGAAQINIGDKYDSIRLSQWDATKLSTVPAQWVDKIVCNLPFGKQIGSTAENKRLYKQFLREMARVLKPKGRMVLLSGQADLLRERLQEIKAFNIVDIIPLRLLGVKARIFVVVKAEG